MIALLRTCITKLSDGGCKQPFFFAMVINLHETRITKIMATNKKSPVAIKAK